MENEHKPIYSGGMLSADADKLAVLGRRERVLNNAQQAQLLGAVKIAKTINLRLPNA